MRFHWPAFLLSLGALFTASASDSQRQYDIQAAPGFLFDRRPFMAECADRTPGQRMEPGVRVVIFPHAPYLRTRPETLTFLVPMFRHSLSLLTRPIWSRSPARSETSGHYSSVLRPKGAARTKPANIFNQFR